MASYLDLVEKVVMLQQLRDNQRTMRTLFANNSSPPFEQLMSKSLGEIDQKTLPSLNSMNGPRGDSVAPLDEEAKFQKSLKFVLEKEGSKLVHEDGGKESSRFGILQSTARAFGFRGNVRNITKEDVEGIYRKLWEKSGASSLPVPLAVVHFDSYINNPASAKRLLEKSKGDIDAYLKLRERRYVRLASAQPEVYGKYLQGWKNRIQSLRTMVAEHTKNGDYASSAVHSARNG